MTSSRVAAALAGMITALLLQATLVSPVTAPAPASLPAVLVAAIALVDGPATGLTFGFALGLVADLSSRHPAGVLALCWLGLGLVAGCVVGVRPRRIDAVVAAVLCTVATLASSVLLILVHADGVTAAETARSLVPAALVDVLLALPVVAIVRLVLHNDALAPAQPVADLAAAGRRA